MKTARAVTETVIKKLNMQDRASTVFEAVKACYAECALVADAISENPKLSKEGHAAASAVAHAIRALGER